MPGTYTVTVSATGFNNWQQTGVVFNANDNRTLSNITMQIAGTAEQVSVVSDAGNVAPVDTGESSNTLNTQMITELSIQGRNAAELIKIMPGMGINGGLKQGQDSSLTAGTNRGPVGSYSANGTQPYGGMSMISDGANSSIPATRVRRSRT